MGEVLILKSINRRVLTKKLIDSWLEANEMYVTKRTFSIDQYSVEMTFVDEERAEMISDLLSTCYGDEITVSRPRILSSSMNDSFEEEQTQTREPSPVHLSSAVSTSSRVSGFSRRLHPTEKLDTSVLRNDLSFSNEKSTEKENSTPTSPSVVGSSISSVVGRGRGAIYK